MLSKDDLWLMEEPLDDPADLLAIPEIKQLALDPHVDEDDVGLWSLYEHPEALKSLRGAEAA